MKNWRTTLIGIVTGAANLVANGMTWKQALISSGIALLGWSASDAPRKSDPSVSTSKFN